jgi:hypothetical protein
MPVRNRGWAKHICCSTGGVPEWTIGAVSKTVVAFLVTVGSNPTPSA